MRPILLFIIGLAFGALSAPEPIQSWWVRVVIAFIGLAAVLASLRA